MAECVGNTGRFYVFKMPKFIGNIKSFHAFKFNKYIEIERYFHGFKMSKFILNIAKFLCVHYDRKYTLFEHLNYSSWYIYTFPMAARVKICICVNLLASLLIVSTCCFLDDVLVCYSQRIFF